MFNKEKFSSILKEINSTYSSMTEFAQKASFDRTYISKYINMKLDNPPTPKILEKLANASNGVTSYYELMKICDYIDLTATFLLTNERKDTNFCYWNKEDLKDLGFDEIDVNKLAYLSNNNGSSKEISDILNKYPDTLLEQFYDKCITQTNLKKEEKKRFDYQKELLNIIQNNCFIFYPNNLYEREITNSIPLKELYKNKVPLLGVVKAGYDYLANENILDYIPISIKKEDNDYYALKIKRR